MNRTALGFALVSIFTLAAWGAGCGAGSGGGTTGKPSGSGASGGAGGSGGSGGAGNGGEGASLVFDAGGGNEDAGFDPDGACATSTVTAKLTPANILFVIDRSGSMSCNPPPLQTSPQCESNPTPQFPAQASKWDIVRDALESAIASMTPSTRVGVTYFNDDDFCGVQQQPHVALAAIDSAQLAALDSSIDAVVPKGATPIIGGVTLGYAHLFADDLAPGNDFVVLLTDGAETCAPELEDTMINQTVPAALSVNIRTFVIGAPGSEPARAFLSQIAWAGGTAKDAACVHTSAPDDVGDCHFDMTDPNLDFATALNDALATISGQAISCELDVPQAVGGDVDYDQVNVTFSTSMGSQVSFLQDDAPCDMAANGWQYNADKTKIILCGDACKMVKADAQGTLSIALGCETKVAR